MRRRDKRQSKKSMALQFIAAQPGSLISINIVIRKIVLVHSKK
jgi:hypothetical protein